MGCIYQAYCVVSRKSYVGFAFDLECRKAEHKKAAEDGCHYIFYRAIRKYGWDAFEWSILYQDEDSNREWLGWWEKKFIRKLKTKMPNGYNMTDGGDGGSGPKSEETRKKLSIAQTGKKHSEETKRKQSIAQTGKVMSEESRAKISAIVKNRIPWNKGKTLSEDHKTKISIAAKGQIPWNKGKKILSSSGQPPGTPGKPPSSPEAASEDETGVEPPTEEEAVKTASRALELAVKSLGLDVAGSGLPAIVANRLIEKAAGR